MSDRLHEIDHIVAAAIVLASAMQAFVDPAAVQQLPRRAFFKAGAMTGLIMGGLVLLLWHVAGRSVADFGLLEWVDLDSPRIALAALLWVALLVAVARLLCRRYRDFATRFYGSYAHLMPQSRGEIPVAYAAGILGGTGEEIAYRGFLIWYAQAFIGLPLSVLVTSLIFGIAHGYQARFGVVFATIAGLILASAYLLSGSLLLVIWMHASYNVASFTLGYRLLSADRSATDQCPSPVQS